MDPRIIAWEQHARRARTATSILDVGAWIGLLAGIIFWAGFFWGMIAPASVPESLLAAALAAGYALVLPMLISLLAPSTPAGMALAETKWKTIGHVLSVAAALFMAFHAFMVLWAWWASRPAVAQTGQDLFLAIGTAIIFVIVPALAWVQIAPDRWVAEVAQAQQVKRLKAAQEANLLAARLQYARAMALLKRGIANATAAEKAELAGTLIAMQRAENEAIGEIAESMRLLTGIDTHVPLLDDPELLGHYDQLTGQLERLIAPINDRDYVELAPSRPTATDRESTATDRESTAIRPYTMDDWRATVGRRDAETVARDRDHAESTVGRDGPQRPAESAARADDLIDRWAGVGRTHASLQGAWKRAELEAALSIEKTKALDLIRAWKQRGYIYDITQPANHYAWKEA